MIESHVATVRRPALEYVRRLLRELDVDVEGVAGEEGGESVPAAVLHRLWEAAGRHDAAVGMRAAARLQASDFGQLGTVFEQAPTLGEALIELSRLLPLMLGGVRLVLVVNGERTTFELIVDEPRLLHPRQAEHLVLMIAFAVQSRLPSVGAFGLTAHWAHPSPFPRVDLARQLGVEVSFDAGWNGVSFGTDALRTRRPGAGAGGEFDEARRRAERDLRARPAPGLVGQVRERIVAAMGSGRPVSETAVARELSLHPKSLSRRLAGRGTTFRRLVDSERLDRSRILLDSGRPVDEVARRVGYGDATAFSRAFKRWTGTTPTAYATLAGAPGTRPRRPAGP